MNTFYKGEYSYFINSRGPPAQYSTIPKELFHPIPNYSNMTYILLIFNLLHLQPKSATPEIDHFLESSATEVEWQNIYDNIRFFLNSGFKKEEIYWYKGTLTAKDGVQYQNLQLKFNTIDNSLFLKNKNQYFRIKAPDLQAFTLQDGDRVRRFVKGYYQSREHQLSATFAGSTQEVMETIMSYEAFGTLEITTINAAKKKGASGELSMRLSSPDLMSVQHFRNYLEGTNLFGELNLLSGATGLGKQTLFEELVAGKGIALLKYYSRKKGTNEMTSIVSDAATQLTFHNNRVYISNTEHQLQEMAFSRKSARKAMLFTGLQWEGKIPAIRKEKQLVAFMKKVVGK